MPLKVGQQARLIQPIVAGEIKDTQFNKSASELEHLLAYETPDGVQHERWFLESSLEPVDAK